MALLICLLAVFAAGCTAAPPSKAQLENAFTKDDFRVTRWVSYGKSRGALAESINATNLHTGQPKRVYYVEGSAYELGRLTALLATPEAEVMATTYIERFVVQLIDYDWWKSHEDTEECRILERVLDNFLTIEANRIWAKVVAAGAIPTPLIEEMKGLADGAASVNASTAVTFEKLVTINFGFDWVSAAAFSGELGPKLLQLVAELNDVSAEAKAKAIRALQTVRGLLEPPAFCDAFLAWGGATKADGHVLMGRAFQLATAEVFQDIAAHIITAPTDGRHASVRVFSPGMVGGITSLGMGGVVIGVDTLRSAAGTPEFPGFNSILLVRHIAETASSTKDALDRIERAQRGCPWLYPLCDASGACAVVEAGSFSNQTADAFDPLRFVRGKQLEKLLPSKSFLQAHSSRAAYRSGMYVRTPGYTFPEAYLGFNAPLFQHVDIPYNASAASSTDGLLFESWKQELLQQKHLENNYFPPQRTGSSGRNDFMIVSNLAIVPEMRLTMMGTAADLFAKTQESAQYRYDTLNRVVHSAYGTLDVATALDAITFLSPDRTPGYWNHTLDPRDPMSAQVEGAVSVASLLPAANQTADRLVLQLHTKTGYWKDNFYTTTLTNYFQ
eukprot:m.487268 g.487268  ORF g.487268 m.487268 type:complete len:615 (-) comp24923_c0_seq1:23-1867(-)